MAWTNWKAVIDLIAAAHTEAWISGSAPAAWWAVTWMSGRVSWKTTAEARINWIPSPTWAAKARIHWSAYTWQFIGREVARKRDHETQLSVHKQSPVCEYAWDGAKAPYRRGGQLSK
jgi:hypothetical protein